MVLRKTSKQQLLSLCIASVGRKRQNKDDKRFYAKLIETYVVPLSKETRSREEEGKKSETQVSAFAGRI